MICQRMMLGGEKEKSWTLRFNTEAAEAGGKKAGIPFNLYGQPGVKLRVDWGDGTTSLLTEADYAENDSTASVHEYRMAGIYDVVISVKSQAAVYILVITASTETTSPTNATISIYYFRRTLVAIRSPLFRVAGVNIYASATNPDSLSKQGSHLYDLFMYCSALSDFPGSLFDNNLHVYNFASCFRSCISLSTLPEGLFAKNTEAAIFSSCFKDCSALGNFELHISSKCVDRAPDFVTQKSGATRTIYVPSGSTTQRTFNAVASSLGLTIVGE